MAKYERVLIEQKEKKRRAKNAMVSFVEQFDEKERNPRLKDFIEKFGKKSPWELSHGTVENYLNELIEEKRIRTWKNGKKRLYGAPKIPLYVKFPTVFILVSTFLFVISSRATNVGVFKIYIFTVFAVITTSFFWWYDLNYGKK